MTLEHQPPILATATSLHADAHGRAMAMSNKKHIPYFLALPDLQCLLPTPGVRMRASLVGLVCSGGISLNCILHGIWTLAAIQLRRSCELGTDQSPFYLKVSLIGPIGFSALGRWPSTTTEVTFSRRPKKGVTSSVWSLATVDCGFSIVTKDVRTASILG